MLIKDWDMSTVYPALRNRRLCFAVIPQSLALPGSRSLSRSCGSFLNIRRRTATPITASGLSSAPDSRVAAFTDAASVTEGSMNRFADRAGTRGQIVRPGGGRGAGGWQVTAPRYYFALIVSAERSAPQSQAIKETLIKSEFPACLARRASWTYSELPIIHFCVSALLAPSFYCIP